MASYATPTCHLCGKAGTIELTSAEVHALNAGGFIQDTLAHRTPSEREQIISGTHPACWTALFGDDEDDE